MLRRNVSFTFVICILAVVVSAQRGTNLPSQQAEEDRRAFYARQIDVFDRLQARVSPRIPKSFLDPLEPGRKKLIKNLTRPTSFESASYPQLFKRSDSGVFSFLSPLSCKEKFDGQLLTQYFGTNCLDMTLPGGGTKFSFRTGDYSNLGYSDLVLFNDALISSGISTHTILADLGEVELLGVSLNDPNFEQLVNYTPAATVEEMVKKEAELKAGIGNEGRMFLSSAPAVTGHTYLLRSIAYSGKFVVVYNLGDSKLRLDLTKDDVRGDVIVVFRLDKTADGDTRVVWRKLRQSQSPKLNFSEIVVNNPAITTKITIIN